MNNLLLIIPFLLIINAPQSEGGVVAVVESDLFAIAQGQSAQELYIGYDYWFQGGVKEELHIFGNGRMYYHKSVHSKAYQDALHDAYNRGERISPFMWSLADCEYGDYDIYEYADLTAQQVQQIAQSLADSDVMETENQYGDNTYHGIRILLPGRESIKCGVLLDRYPQLQNAVEFLADDLPNMVEMNTCTKAEFSHEMTGSIESANMEVS